MAALYEHPIFTQGLVLSSSTLNTTRDFLLRQLRLSRLKLAGVGIHHGLSLCITPHENGPANWASLAISAGAGVSTQGHLLQHQGLSLTHLRTLEWQEQQGLIALPEDASHGNPLAYELFTTEAAQEANNPEINYTHSIQPLANEPASSFNNHVVLLLLNTQERNLADEYPEYSNAGKEMRYTLRVLLLHQNVAAALAREGMPPAESNPLPASWQQDTWPGTTPLPPIAPIRVSVTPKGTIDQQRGNTPFNPPLSITTANLWLAYSQAARQVVLEMQVQLTECLKMLEPFSQEHLASTATTLSNLMPTIYGLLTNNSTKTQYVYDLVIDLLADYTQLRAQVHHLVAQTPLLPDNFGQHLMLGTLSHQEQDLPPGQANHKAFRHHWMPAINGPLRQHNLTRLLALLTGMANRLENFDASTNELRVTPSPTLHGTHHPGALPLYYPITANKQWNHTLNRTEREAENQGHRLQNPNSPGPTTTPLAYNQQPTGFWRVGQTVGQPIASAMATLEGLIKEHHLPWQVVKASLNRERTELVDWQNWPHNMEDLHERFHEHISRHSQWLKLLKESIEEARLQEMLAHGLSPLNQGYTNLVNRTTQLREYVLNQNQHHLPSWNMAQYQAYYRQWAEALWFVYTLPGAAFEQALKLFIDWDKAVENIQYGSGTFNALSQLLAQAPDRLLLQPFRQIYQAYLGRQHSLRNYRVPTDAVENLLESGHAMHHAGGTTTGGTLVLLYNHTAATQPVVGDFMMPHGCCPKGWPHVQLQPIIDEAILRQLPLPPYARPMHLATTAGQALNIPLLYEGAGYLQAENQQVELLPSEDSRFGLGSMPTPKGYVALESTIDGGIRAVYSPNADAEGPDTFLYRITNTNRGAADDGLVSNPAYVTVWVGPPTPNVLIAENYNEVLSLGQSTLSIDLTDPEDGVQYNPELPLEVSINNQPTTMEVIDLDRNGKVRTLKSPLGGLLQIAQPQEGSPTLHYFRGMSAGQDYFHYTISQEGAQDSTGTIAIDAPPYEITAGDGHITVMANHQANINLLALPGSRVYNSLPNAPVSTLLELPNGQVASTLITAMAGGKAIANANNTLTYNAPPEAGEDEVQYQLLQTYTYNAPPEAGEEEVQAHMVSNTATITIEITPDPRQARLEAYIPYPGVVTWAPDKFFVPNNIDPEKPFDFQLIDELGNPDTKLGIEGGHKIEFVEGPEPGQTSVQMVTGSLTTGTYQYLIKQEGQAIDPLPGTVTINPQPPMAEDSGTVEWDNEITIDLTENDLFKPLPDTDYYLGIEDGFGSEVPEGEPLGTPKGSARLSYTEDGRVLLTYRANRGVQPGLEVLYYKAQTHTAANKESFISTPVNINITVEGGDIIIGA